MKAILAGIKRSRLIIFIFLALGIFTLSFYFKNKRNIKEFNIIFIVVDALRPDHLSCYGYNRITSPNIDKLAKGGTRFTQAFSQTAWTLISIPSIFTSLYPNVLETDINKDAKIRFVTLPGMLKKSGYINGLFSTHPFPFFKKDFDTVLCNMYERNITQKAISWLRSKPKGKFFLYLHYMDTHNPYILPEFYSRLYSRTKDGEYFNRLRDSLYFAYMIPSNLQKKRTDVLRLQDYFTNNPAALDFVISQYDGAIRYMDDQIGILIGELKNTGLLDNSLIILTADHGEEFLEHGYLLHGHQLYDESMRVPLVMRLPGVIPRNRVFNKLVGSIDIMPTILDLLNIHARITMQGATLMPFIKYNIPQSPCIYSIIYSTKNAPSPAGYAIRTDKWKFILHVSDNNAYNYELYNIRQDPQELINVEKQNPNIRKKLEKRLNLWLAECQRMTMDSKTDRGSDVVIDEKIRAELRALGYFQ